MEAFSSQVSLTISAALLIAPSAPPAPCVAAQAVQNVIVSDRNGDAPAKRVAVTAGHRKMAPQTSQLIHAEFIERPGSVRV